MMSTSFVWKTGALMSELGLGCAKTPAVAPRVEIFPSNCISESQIVLHTRGSTPCWRIVFSTFLGCMSFYTARVRLGRGGMSALSPFYPQLRTLVGAAGTAAQCHFRTPAPQQNYSITSSASACSVAGMVSPSALAVLRLRCSSNLVGCSTGSSAGCAPFSIFTTRTAAWRYMSASTGK
jgi:hypothetical protein